jgi:stress-induced morphogen
MDLKERLEQVLKSAFAEPQVEADLRPHGKVDALVVSSSFAAVRDVDRQTMIWQVLRRELTPEELLRVSFVLAVSPDEEMALGDFGGA